MPIAFGNQPATFFVAFYGGSFDGLIESFQADPSTIVLTLVIQPDRDPGVRAIYVADSATTAGLLRTMRYRGTCAE
ncbi:hypothetical protein ACFVZD_42770 [Streptomyces sp. NPDC058287]|uniref:hypothetical protein n=1 Tax=unclassified Streptomyces TaxID=2593676 RepID=UPI0036E12B36